MFFSRKKKTAVNGNGEKKIKKDINGSKKKRAEIFVDFEHWYISLDRQFSLKPAIRAWRDSVAESYDILSITFFGDFSNSALRDEIPRLREVSSRLIDTQNPSQHYKKDFTDFIMLDSIYQHAMNSDGVDTFIIFTGDGHFNSVVSFLRTTLGKEVVIYGVREATSTLLKNSASSFILLPTDEEIEFSRKKLLVSTINELYEKRKAPRPTFVATVNAVSGNYNLDRDMIFELLNSLIKSGHVVNRRYYVSKGRFIKVLALDTEKCIADGLL